jgi:hypothetical protein
MSVEPIADEMPKSYRPIRPSFIRSLIPWLPFVPGIALAVNWRGLGKPQWILPTLLLSIGIPIVTIGGIVIVLHYLPARTFFAYYLEVFFVGAMLGLNIGYITGLAFLQKPAYHKWYQGRTQAMLAHLYDFEAALWKAGAWTIGITAVIGILGMLALIRT